jgi:hypothetical protein
MNKLFACLIAVAAVSLTAGETQAQHFHRGGFGGSGFGISVGNGFNNFGYNNFRGGYGRSFGGVSVNVGNRGFVPYNRGFGGGFVAPVYVPRQAYRPVYAAPVYRGGFYGGGRRGCGW